MDIDLTTQYLGLTLKSPLVAGAVPLTGLSETVRILEQAGAGAAVVPCICQERPAGEDLALQHLCDLPSESNPESVTYFPNLQQEPPSAAAYLSQFEEVKRQTRLPLIASLNGSPMGHWSQTARLLEQAGADALELNLFLVPIDPEEPSGLLEDRYCETVSTVRQEVKIPVAVKIGPYVTGLPRFARALLQAGADGLVLFSRYLTPDVDPEDFRVQPKLELCSRSDLGLVLRWIGILRDQTDQSLGATGGVHEVDDLIKAIAVGADVVMVASALRTSGWQHLERLHRGLETWLQSHDYPTLTQLKGSLSRLRCRHPEAFCEANFTQAITLSSGEFV